MLPQDSEVLPPEAAHLDALGIAFYVMGGIGALFSLFPIFHVAIGIAMMMNPDFFSELDQKGNVPPFPGEIFGLFFVIIGGGFMLWGFTMATLTVVTGRYLRARKHYWFCLVFSCVKCIGIPLGTILGVFSIIVLSKDAAKALFPQFSELEKPESGR